jgi:hypothetical protein
VRRLFRWLFIGYIREILTEEMNKALAASIPEVVKSELESAFTRKESLIGFTAPVYEERE